MCKTISVRARVPGPYGDEVVPVINRLLEHRWLSVATMDWHPAEHCSFRVPWRPMAPIACSKQRERVAPRVRCPTGAADHHQGVAPRSRGVFRFPWYQSGEILRDKGVHRVGEMCGIATDYCVQATAHDALHEGFGYWCSKTRFAVLKCIGRLPACYCGIAPGGSRDDRLFGPQF